MRYRCAAIAAVAPSPAAVTAWPAESARTSPAANSPGELGPHPRVRHHAAALVERDDAGEELGVRDAAGMHEDGRDRDRRRLAAREVAHADPVDAAVAEDLLDDGSVPDLDVRALCHPPGVGRLAAERFPCVDQHDPDVVAAELQRLEERGVAPADHRHLRAAEERPVAARAVADPLAGELPPRPGRQVAAALSRWRRSARRRRARGRRSGPPSRRRGARSPSPRPARPWRPRRPPAPGGEARSRSRGSPRGSLASPRSARCSGSRRPFRAGRAVRCSGPGARRRAPPSARPARRRERRRRDPLAPDPARDVADQP